MFILVELEGNEGSSIEFLSSDGICAMLFEPWDDVLDVEDGACGSADRVFKWLEREGAVCEWQSLERVLTLARGNATGTCVLSNLATPFRAPAHR